MAHPALTHEMSGPNRLASILKLPPELMYHIAYFLPIQMLLRVTLVCSVWRSLLLSLPDLWTRIIIAFTASDGEDSRPFWQPVLRTLFKRSGDLPLDIDMRIGREYRFGDQNSPELADVAALVTDNMHRIKSLALSISPTRGQDRIKGSIPAYLLARAPILERFRLRINSLSGTMVVGPNELFGNHAPRLQYVELSGNINLVSKPLLSFPSITELCFKRNEFDRRLDAVMFDLLAQLPALQYLTLDADPFTLQPPCLKPLHLQVHMQNKWNALDHFPNVRSLCYALGPVHGSGNDWEVSAANLTPGLQKFVERGEVLTSLDMRLGRLCVLPRAGLDGSLRMTVKANGEYIAVDVDWIRQTRLIATALPLFHLERLVLPEGIWDEFMDYEMPHLKELTIYLRRTLEWWPLKQPSIKRNQWKLSVLRFACVRMPSTDDAIPLSRRIKAVDVATLIRRNFDAAVLTKIALQGWELCEPGMMTDLTNLIPHVRLIDEDEIACGEWEEPKRWPTTHLGSEGIQL